MENYTEIIMKGAFEGGEEAAKALLTHHKISLDVENFKKCAKVVTPEMTQANQYALFYDGKQLGNIIFNPITSIFTAWHDGVIIAEYKLFQNDK